MMVVAEDPALGVSCLGGEEIVADSEVACAFLQVAVVAVRMGGEKVCLRTEAVVEKHVARHHSAATVGPVVHLAGNFDIQDLGHAGKENRQ